MVEHYLDKEVWKDIPGFEGEYQVSAFGRIRSLDTIKYYLKNGKQEKQFHKGKILKPYQQAGGYLTVTLYKDGLEEFWFVHRLLAITFLENPKGWKSVSFKDGNKSNVKLENIMWGRKSKREKIQSSDNRV